MAFDFGFRRKTYQFDICFCINIRQTPITSGFWTFYDFPAVATIDPAFTERNQPILRIIIALYYEVT
jgi:hypothetical protein